ncbi:hypothetical protein SCLCIDRAFT_113287 [Scleroderma citrinum Foug A]|uniref:Uncharacterized protein n=1 Tax=Scleroderma citrinum Foug A TaxID=1036808 RepID=A0A0C2ZUQ7_9AGAM|nr:hypothetical protein SCLCIDRAFT_113287 [Scleroderma citrinum Foug A]
MCHWRRVRTTYLVCRHAYDLVSSLSVQIQCDNRHCKFSSTHPSNCLPPECLNTCWQYRQFPQQYNPQINTLCPRCMQRLP